MVTGVNLGLSNLLGSLVPMAILHTTPTAKVLTVLLIGQAILLIGVAVLSKAGFIKNEDSNGGSASTEDKSTKSGGVFVKGLILALASGAGSAAINIGAICIKLSSKSCSSRRGKCNKCQLIIMGCCILWWIYCQFWIRNDKIN